MAVLHHLATDRLASLGARTTIGRSRACTLRLEAARASGEHAAMLWTHDGWHLRDLGSSNGTWLGDQRLSAGQEVPVAVGDTLAFGDTSDRWVLTDDGAPSSFARGELDGAVVHAEGGVLGLPSAEDPEVMVFQGAQGWIAEGPARRRAVIDQDVLTVQGVAWRLFLPMVLDTTLMDDGQRETTLVGLRLELRVSRDHEFVGVTLHDGDRPITVPPRTLHYMLVVLAQARQHPADPPADEHAGWVDVEEVARALMVDYRTVGVYVCRLRQQLGGLGIAAAGEIIERRPGALRLGRIPVALVGG